MLNYGAIRCIGELEVLLQVLRSDFGGTVEEVKGSV